MLLMFVCLQEVLQLSSLLVRQLFFPLRFCPEFMGLRITDNLAGHIAGSFRSTVIWPTTWSINEDADFSQVVSQIGNNAGKPT